jgi:hypothetical protein
MAICKLANKVGLQRAYKCVVTRSAGKLVCVMLKAARQCIFVQQMMVRKVLIRKVPRGYSSYL